MQIETKRERIFSVDFLRGLTVAFMIFVNSPGSWDYVCPWFAHAKWNGCTPTDLIFPFFLFIVGLSISFSFSSARSAPVSPSLILKIIKRSMLLFLIGVLINGFPFYQLDTLRIPGVLQRIAIVFMCCSLLFLYTSIRVQIAMTLLILTGYWIVMTFVPLPGGIAGSLEPGKNMAAWADQYLLKGHVWRQTKPWDPEGVLSTLPAIASGLIGVITGGWIKQTEEKKRMIIHLFIAGNGLLLLALAWNPVFPLNKNLWTSSYVLFTSGIALQALAACYWFLDVQQYRKGTGWASAFGSNAMAAYILSELIEAGWNVITLPSGISLKSWVFEHGFLLWLNPYLASHLMALLFVGVIYVPVYFLYKKRIFLRV
jgi:predicted acyltransferase